MNPKLVATQNRHAARRATISNAKVSIISASELSLLLKIPAAERNANVNHWMWLDAPPFVNALIEDDFLKLSFRRYLLNLIYICGLCLSGIVCLEIYRNTISHDTGFIGTRTGICFAFLLLIGLAFTHIKKCTHHALKGYIICQVTVLILGPILIMSVTSVPAAAFVLIMYVFTSVVILNPTKFYTMVICLEAVVLYIVILCDGFPLIGDCSVETKIVDFLLVIFSIIMTVFLYNARDMADRLAFANGRTLDDTWRTTQRVLSAALPHQILPALLDHVIAKQDWNNAPVMVEPDVTVIVLRFPDLSHPVFPQKAVAAVAQLNALWALCDAIGSSFDVTTLEINNTEFVGVMGLGMNPVCINNHATAVRAGLAIIAALPRAFADVAVVGIHSGPAIAAFVGTLRPRFSLVGETMKIALRMADVALPGSVTVSATTFPHLASLFSSTEREITVNGGVVGVMDRIVVFDIATEIFPAIEVSSGTEPTMTNNERMNSTASCETERSSSNATPNATTTSLILLSPPTPLIESKALTARFPPPPFALLTGFTDKEIEARYLKQAVSPRNTQMIAALLVCTLSFEITNNGDTITFIPLRFWFNLGAIVVALLIGLVTVVSPTSPFSIRVTSIGYIACMSLSPLFAQQLWSIVLASIVLVFCPMAQLSLVSRCATCTVHALVLTVMDAVGLYRLIKQDIITPGSSTAVIFWVWLMFFFAILRNINTDRISRSQFAHEEALNASQDAGEAVLSHLLPRSLLEKLAAGHELDALTTENDDVAVLVADIGGFTSCLLADPSIVFDRINTAFREIERVAHAEGAFKVKTVGDCIVFTSGLRDFPGPAADRASRVALLLRIARGIHAAAAHLALRMRIGIHVGSLVSGVLNSRGFMYDVWGEGILHAMAAEEAAPLGGTAVTSEALATIDPETARSFQPIIPLNSERGRKRGRTLGFYSMVEAVDARQRGPTATSTRELTLSMNQAAFALSDRSRGMLLWSWDVYGGGNAESHLPAIALELLRPSLACGLVTEAAAVFITSKLCASYSRLPFHNAFHGVATMQVITLMATTVPAVRAALSDFDVFLLSVATLGHDAGHGGYNNAFEVAVGSSVALAYGIDGPVLERYHAALTIQMLDESGALAQLTADVRAAALHSATAAILATDMSQHDGIVSELERCLDSPSGMGTLNHNSLCGALTHAADLSAHTFPRAVSLAWSVRISDEFGAQAAAEKSHGIFLTPFMVGLDKPLPRAKMQANFAKSVVVPLWRALAALANGALAEPMKNLEGNTAYYAAEADRLSVAVIPVNLGFFSAFSASRSSLSPLHDPHSSHAEERYVEDVVVGAGSSPTNSEDSKAPRSLQTRTDFEVPPIVSSNDVEITLTVMRSSKPYEFP